MDTQQFQGLSDRVAALEVQMQAVDAKVSRLLIIFERGSGAWWLLRWLGALVVGGAAVWAAVGDHIHWR